MKKTLIFVYTFVILSSCNQSTPSSETEFNDSIDNREMNKVDMLLKNDDSLIKQKEKELLEKYNH